MSPNEPFPMTERKRKVIIAIIIIAFLLAFAVALTDTSGRRHRGRRRVLEMVENLRGISDDSRRKGLLRLEVYLHQRPSGHDGGTHANIAIETRTQHRLRHYLARRPSGVRVKRATRDRVRRLAHGSGRRSVSVGETMSLTTFDHARRGNCRSPAPARWPTPEMNLSLPSLNQGFTCNSKKEQTTAH